MRLVLSIISAAILLGIVIAGIVLQPAHSATLAAPGTQLSELKSEAAPLSETLYDGSRASQLLGSAIFSIKGEYLGEVRNVVLADSGQITSLIAEGAGTRNDPEFVFQIPWSRIKSPLRAGAIMADFSDVRSREYGLFLDPDYQKASKGFRVTKVLGDYARLQTGLGFGYVSDLVFDSHGKLIATLVSRDASAGGGTYAFPYPGETGKWSPAMSYYGLPYVTDEQASKAGLRVNLSKFGRQS